MTWLRSAGSAVLTALLVLAAVLSFAQGAAAAGVGLAALSAALVVHQVVGGRSGSVQEPPGTGTIHSSGRDFSGLVMRSSRRGVATGCVVGALMTLGCAALAVAGAGLVAVLCAVAMGAMTLLGVVSLLRGTATLVFTTDELAHVASFGHASVRWDEVTDVQHYSLAGTTFLRVSAERTALAGRVFIAIAHLSRRRRLEVAPSALGVDDYWLGALIETCASDAAVRAEVARGEVQGRP